MEPKYTLSPINIDENSIPPLPYKAIKRFKFIDSLIHSFK